MNNQQDTLARLSNAYTQYIEGAITYSEFLMWILVNVDYDYVVTDNPKHAELIANIVKTVTELRSYQLSLFAGPTD